MTKALLTAGALVALSLAMQEAALGQPSPDDPLSTLRGAKHKRMDDRQAATKPPRPPVPAMPPAAEPQVAMPKPEELEQVRPGLGGLVPLASGTFTTANSPGQPPHAPPPPAPQQASGPSVWQPWASWWRD